MQPLRRTIIGTLLVVVNLTATTMAQSGGSYDLTWNTIDGGGGTSSGGSITLTGTIGQPDAGVMSGGSLTLSGGFWFPLDFGDCDWDGTVSLFDEAAFVGDRKSVV